LLKQDQFSPLKLEEQAISIFSGVRGHLDSLSLSSIKGFEGVLLKLSQENVLFKNMKEFVSYTGSFSDDSFTFLGILTKNLTAKYEN
jgi:F-type H+-transporting ATPase subunit alpha